MTSKLAFRFSPGGRARLRELDSILDQAYHAKEETLGNQTDPLDESIYIILSLQTDLERSRGAWQKLRSTYKEWEDVEQTETVRLAEVLKEGGLQHQKAKAIKNLLASVRDRFGKLSLDVLGSLTDTEAELELTRLPGLSWKAARCVLSYSLNRDVFPIDVNTFRILKRVGAIPSRTVYRRRSTHDTLQAAVPPGRRRPLHVNLVIHGRALCLPERPLCLDCPANPFCAKRLHINGRI